MFLKENVFTCEPGTSQLLSVVAQKDIAQNFLPWTVPCKSASKRYSFEMEEEERPLPCELFGAEFWESASLLIILWESLFQCVETLMC